mgnify:CR=1 FL=1
MIGKDGKDENDEDKVVKIKKQKMPMTTGDHSPPPLPIMI